MSHLILDGIFVLIIIIGIVFGIKRGAVKIVFSLIAFVLAAYLAYFFSTPLATFINGKFIAPSVSSDIYEAVRNGENPADTLPGYITENAEKLGVDLNDLQLTSVISEDSVISFVNSKISPIVISVLSTIFIIILFIAFSILLNLFVNLFNKLIKCSFVGGLNSFLGAIFGALNGLVITAVICLIISLTMKYGFIYPFNITEETVKSSFFYSIFLYIF